MDEGVAGYVSYIALNESGRQDSVRAWHELQLEIARKAVADDRWIPLSDISSANGWNAAEVSRPGLALAESYAVVSYLAANYGLDKCIMTYKAVKSNGGNAESALFMTTDLTVRQLEMLVWAWLSETDPAMVTGG